MTMGETMKTELFERCDKEELELYQNLASKFVEEIINKAAEEAIKKIRELEISKEVEADNCNVLTSVPQIQIDLAGPRTPETPDEIQVPLLVHKTRKTGKRVFVFKADNEEEEEKGATKPKELPRKDVEDFALSYVNEIIAKATELACKRIGAKNSATKEPLVAVVESPTAPTAIQIQTKIVQEEPWYSGVRKIFNRLLMSGCLCKSKNHSDQNSRVDL